VRILRIASVFLAALLIGAHLLRAGWFPLALVAFHLPLLLASGRAWAVRGVQAGLALAVFEWLRTLVVLVDARQAAGQSWLRMAAILGAVIALTAASIWLLEGWRRPAAKAGEAHPVGAGEAA
jgi:hypothetical protein